MSTSVAQFTTITSEGGLLSSDLISRLVNDSQSLPGTRGEDYRLTPGRELREIINRSWNDLLGAWQVFQPQVARMSSDDHTAALTWERWLLPLFAEMGYGRLDRYPESLVVGDKDYPISHRHEQAFVHLVGWNVQLDRRTAGVVGAAKAAPHSMVQELLNRTDEHLWAILSNGRQLRIVRDNSSLTRSAYVEFDLEQMFSEGIFTDFVALWLLVHASRVEGDPQSGCWLEVWANEARQQGVRALDTLGRGFEDAIETLGQGFLAHPANGEVRRRLQEGELSKQDYYRQLLRVVYRLVFLFVAEDRSLLHPPNAAAEAKERYSRYYSISRVRDLARRRRGTKHGDLWNQFVVVARCLGPEGQPILGLPALNSGLWATDVTVDLDSARISNAFYLAAVRSLAYTRQHDVLNRVDYRNLGSEELGSVYESLLELQPVFDSATSTFQLQHASGNERKTTGSYYTPTSLISALLDTSLDHLIDEAAAQPDPGQALLNLKVIDPACGSGHFLVAAAQRIAKRLAVLRTGETDPPPRTVRHALREVIGRCVYGIDRNPMAVELCKVSLWLESVEPGRPLSFLDHHIVCGNGLLGTTPRLLQHGVPDSAFTPIEGDDKTTAATRKKLNAKERDQRSQGLLGLVFRGSALTATLAAEMAFIEALPSETPAQVSEQASRYQRLQESVDAEKVRLEADAWCAAFMAIKTPSHPVISDATVRMLGEHPEGVSTEVLDEVTVLARQHRFLHWHLAFPQVFAVNLDGNSQLGCDGGFDLVFGNPPWETMSPDRREFLGQHIPGIRAMAPEEQDAAIDKALEETQLAAAYESYRRDLFAQVHFLKNSGRYTLFAKGNLGKGDFNIYRMFVETALRNARGDGYAAQITPGGLYGGANASAIRHFLLDDCNLDTVFGYDNYKKYWFDVDMARFSAYSARTGGRTQSFQGRFGLAQPEDYAKDAVTVQADLIREQAPETYAIPDLRSVFEMTVAAKMVGAYPPFGVSSAGPPTRHFQAEVHMGNDKGLFTTDSVGVPLYEGRMIDHFDHRAKVYVSGHGNSAKWEELAFDDPGKAIRPQWRVLRRDVPAKLGENWKRYRIGFGDVASARDRRSFVAALIPPNVLCGDTVPTLDFEPDYEWAYLPWLAVANSFAMDWLTRTRLSSAHLKWFIVDRLPFPRFSRDHPLVSKLAPLVLRLTCTSLEMTEYWNSMAEFGWCEPCPTREVPADAITNPEARSDVRAEVDAIVAKHVYGFTIEEMEYVLDQFPVLERYDRRIYGSFVTKDNILAIFDDV
jgi:hypothetical protein